MTAAVAVALSAFAVAACNGKSASDASTRSTHPTNGSSVTTSASTASATGTRITSKSGYTYVIAAKTVSGATSVQSYQDAQMTAPPGEQYLQASVVITDPLSDRPEPDIGFTDNGDGVLELAIAKSDAGKLPDSSKCDSQVTVNACIMVSSEYGPEVPAPASPVSPQIQAKSSVVLTVFAGPVPDSISASDASVYYDDGGGQPRLVANG